jgi:hypothetical protein
MTFVDAFVLFFVVLYHKQRDFTQISFLKVENQGVLIHRSCQKINIIKCLKTEKRVLTIYAVSCNTTLALSAGFSSRDKARIILFIRDMFMEKIYYYYLVKKLMGKLNKLKLIHKKSDCSRYIHINTLLLGFYKFSFPVMVLHFLLAIYLRWLYI